MVTRERVTAFEIRQASTLLRAEARAEYGGMKYRPKAAPRDSIVPAEPKPARVKVIDRSARRAHAVRMGWEKRDVAVVDNSAPVRSMVATRPADKPMVRVSDAPTMPQQRGTWPNGMPRF